MLPTGFYEHSNDDSKEARELRHPTTLASSTASRVRDFGQTAAPHNSANSTEPGGCARRRGRPGRLSESARPLQAVLDEPQCTTPTSSCQDDLCGVCRKLPLCSTLPKATSATNPAVSIGSSLQDSPKTRSRTCTTNEGHESVAIQARVHPRALRNGSKAPFRREGTSHSALPSLQTAQRTKNRSDRSHRRRPREYQRRLFEPGVLPPQV